jgi:hypothetical protein
LKIEIAVPPNYSEILGVFPHIADQAILFAYGDIIYNPKGVFVPEELVAHEAVHGARQGTEVTAWWDSYLESPEFRLLEEIPAHRAEYNAFCKAVKDRNKRARYAHAVASRLSGKLYSLDIKYKDALKCLLK